jgi:hypothetical protein
MKRILAPVTLFALSLVLWNCKDNDDPAPDLSSSTISFLWDFTAGSSTTFFAVVSDTSGNVLKWDQIIPGTQLDLPYPPNGNLATVTLIVRASGSSGHATFLNTFTGLQPGKYTLKPEPDPDFPEKDGTFKFGILNPVEDFQFLAQYMTGTYEFVDVAHKDTDYTYNYGVYDDAVNNLFVWGSTDETREIIKYRYFTDVNADDSLGVSKESFDGEFEVMPFHNITYPGLSESVSSEFYVTGITIDNGPIDIDDRLFLAGTQAKITYADIPDLFPQYRTVMNSFSNDGNSFYEKNTAKNPDLDFSNLNVTLDKVYKLTTKRIALDLSGEGEVVYLEQHFGTTADPLYYYVYAPVSSKVRMNLPQFPQDLTDKISNLSKITDEQPFDILYIDEYNMSYPDFFSFFLSNDLFGYPPNMRSKGFDVSGTARMSADPGQHTLPKRFQAKKPDYYAK